MAEDTKRFNIVELLKSPTFIVLFLLILVQLIIVVPINMRRAVPVGPIIGGDINMDTGTIRQIAHTLTPWIDAEYGSGIVMIYPWLQYFIYAIISLVVSLDSFLIWSGLLVSILAMLVWYFVGKEFYGEKVGVLTAIFFFLYRPIYVFADPKEILPIFVGLSILFMLKMMKTDVDFKKGLKYAILSGAFAAFCFMSNTVFFMLFGIPFFFLLLYIFFKKYPADNKLLTNHIKLFLVFLTSGALVSSPYWYPILSFIRSPSYAGFQGAEFIDMEFYLHGSSMAHRLSLFVSSGNTPAILLIPLVIVGLILLLQRKRLQDVLVLSGLLCFALGSFQDLFMPLYIASAGYFMEFIRLFYCILLSLGVVACVSSIAKYYKKEFANIFKIALTVLMLLAVVLNVPVMRQQATLDPFVPQSFQPHDGFITEPAEWINENTNPSDLLVGHPYYTYAMFGLTGRHVLTVMYGHVTAAMVDSNPRRIDNRRIFESNDIGETLSLLKKYDAKYLIIDPYAMDETVWFEDNFWDVRTGKMAYGPTARNLDKFFTDSHFEKVYEYTMPQGGQMIPAVVIFEIKYD